MRCKWFISLTVIMIMLTMGSVTATATTVTSTDPVTQVEIPDSVKNLDDLVDYLKSKSIIKTTEDFMEYMKNNKQVILKLNPNIIDYGYSFRMYAEVNKQFNDNGFVNITHAFGNKNVQSWSIPVILSNTSDQSVEIGKNKFALVPKLIPNGHEINVLAIEPEYIIDGSTGYVQSDFNLPPNHEVNLNVVFYVYSMTTAQNVNLRIFDGKDHIDLQITKP